MTLTTTKKNSNGHPEHIKPGWISLAAAMQAALSKQGWRGYTKVTLRFVTHDLDVERWLPPQFEKISPESITNGGVKEAIVLVGIMEME